MFGLTLVLTFLVVLIISRIMNSRRMRSLSEENNNVRAFLLMIRRCEGTAGPDGYRTMFTGKLFSDFSKHPNIANSANGYTSTAAGAYQFLYSTWKDLQRSLLLPDFSPASQDAGAVELIRRRGALDDVIAGDIATAVDKCAKEWASLPVVTGAKAGKSYYGQPVKSLATVTNYYTSAGGQLA